MTIVTTIEELETLYGTPHEAALVKVTSHLTASYRHLIEASPFAVLATSGPEGLDCSPRGDKPGWIRMPDDKTLLIPDRRGNNRIDSLRNILRDPRIALLFLIPGSGTTLRLNGTAKISIDPDLLASFAVEEKAPRSVTIVTIEEVYFQCARAIRRAGLWNAELHVDPTTLPTPGQILSEQSEGRVGGEAYDKEWPERARKSMW